MEALVSFPLLNWQEDFSELDRYDLHPFCIEHICDDVFETGLWSMGHWSKKSRAIVASELGELIPFGQSDHSGSIFGIKKLIFITRVKNNEHIIQSYSEYKKSKLKYDLLKAKDPATVSPEPHFLCDLYEVTNQKFSGKVLQKILDLRGQFMVTTSYCRIVVFEPLIINKIADMAKNKGVQFFFLEQSPMDMPNELLVECLGEQNNR
jgi:hypothetical protein